MISVQCGVVPFQDMVILSIFKLPVCSSELALKKKKSKMMGICVFRRSESVSWCSQLLEVTKEIPFLSTGVYFQYPPSHKSAGKRSPFSSKESGVQNSLYGKKSNSRGNCKAHLMSSWPACFAGLFFQLANTFQSVKLMSPPLYQQESCLAVGRSHDASEH